MVPPNNTAPPTPPPCCVLCNTRSTYFLRVETCHKLPTRDSSQHNNGGKTDVSTVLYLICSHHIYAGLRSHNNTYEGLHVAYRQFTSATNTRMPIIAHLLFWQHVLPLLYHYNSIISTEYPYLVHITIMNSGIESRAAVISQRIHTMHCTIEPRSAEMSQHININLKI